LLDRPFLYFKSLVANGETLLFPYALRNGRFVHLLHEFTKRFGVASSNRGQESLLTTALE